MLEKCDVIADGPKDKKQSKNCFYVTKLGCVVYVGHKNDIYCFRPCFVCLWFRKPRLGHKLLTKDRGFTVQGIFQVRNTGKLQKFP
jgi:hypothetical protein